MSSRLTINWRNDNRIGMIEDAIARYIAQNIRQLRQSRSLTQEQLARLSGVPRPTWSNLESGMANPTVAVLAKVAAALQVPLEELISPPKAQARLYQADSLPRRQLGGVLIRRLLPDHLHGMELDRMELSPGAQMTGVPHRLGTREYLACESGQVELVVSGEKYELSPGDVVVFRGDQKHSYANRSRRVAVAYSAVLLGPARIG
jgi:XRE family transcriptional regulator, regulator of sulfur utilization